MQCGTGPTAQHHHLSDHPPAHRLMRDWWIVLTGAVGSVALFVLVSFLADLVIDRIRRGRREGG